MWVCIFAVQCIVIVPVCGFVCVFVCLWACCHDSSKLRASVFARLGLWVKVVAISNVVHTALILRDFLSVIKIFWPNISRDVVLGTCTCTRVQLEYRFQVLVLVLVLATLYSYLYSYLELFCFSEVQCSWWHHQQRTSEKQMRWCQLTICMMQLSEFSYFA